MAGNIVYSPFQPNTSESLGGIIAGKVRSARNMAAEERRYQKEQGVEKPTSNLFRKALGAEFGGDFRRRVAGTFSRNPSDAQDPALDKQTRFQSLVRAGTPLQTPELQNVPEPSGDMSQWTSSLLKIIADNNKKISESIKGIGKKVETESSTQEAQNKSFGNLTSVLTTLRSYFKKSNDLDKGTLDLEKQDLELSKEVAQDRKDRATEAKQDELGIQAGNEDYDPFDPKGSLTGAILDTLNPKKLLGNLFGGGKKGKGRKTSSYGKEIGPLPMNSAQPWAKAGPGEMGDAAGFVPRLAAGGFNPGIYSRPTTGRLMPGQGVVPLNRNNPIADMMDKTKKVSNTQSSAAGSRVEAKLLADAINLPVKFSGAYLISLTEMVFREAGAFSRLLAPIVNNIFNPIASAYGLPPSSIASAYSGEGSQEETKVSQTRAAVNAGDKTTSKYIKPVGSNPLPSDVIGFDPSVAKDRTDDFKNFKIPEKTIRFPSSKVGKVGGEKFPMTGRFNERRTRRDGTQYNHGGIDIAARTGAGIAIRTPGKVEMIDRNPNNSSGWGKYVVIAHPNGYDTLYGHMNKIFVKRGEFVGDVADPTIIGEVGSTGISDGPHVHFEYGQWDGYVMRNKPADGGTSQLNSYFGIVPKDKLSEAQSTQPVSQQKAAKPAETILTSMELMDGKAYQNIVTVALQAPSMPAPAPTPEFVEESGTVFLSDPTTRNLHTPLFT